MPFLSPPGPAPMAWRCHPTASLRAAGRCRSARRHATAVLLITGRGRRPRVASSVGQGCEGSFGRRARRCGGTGAPPGRPRPDGGGASKDGTTSERQEVDAFLTQATSGADDHRLQPTTARVDWGAATPAGHSATDFPSAAPDIGGGPARRAWRGGGEATRRSWVVTLAGRASDARLPMLCGSSPTWRA
jgi:hypothetical protein